VVDSIVDRFNNQTKFGTIIMSRSRSLLCRLKKTVGQANCVIHSLTRVSKLYAYHQIFDLIPSSTFSIVMNEIMCFYWYKKTNY